MVPEFTNDGTVEEVKQAPVETVEEKETPSELPAEQPEVEEKPVVEEKPQDDALVRANEGLKEERLKLLKEIQELRGQRREIKQGELNKVNQQIDELKDVNPDDVATIDKILRAKGYLTKEESQRMHFESVKQEKVNEFLEKYPEYKPENDPHDINWNTLQREFSIYAMPSDPRLILDRLERAHKSIAKAPTANIEVKKQQAKVAGVGSGGVQRSPSKKSLDPDKREALRRGGWSEEEISSIESKL